MELRTFMKVYCHCVSTITSSRAPRLTFSFTRASRVQAKFDLSGIHDFAHGNAYGKNAADAAGDDLLAGL